MVSFPLGVFIDVGIIFRPSPDVLGHGMPIFTILLPLLSIVIIISAAVVCVTEKLLRKKRYEYLKIFCQSDDPRAPVLIFHEIDLYSGRCSIKCIQIYNNRYVECLTNHGVYSPIPTAESINTPFLRRAYITTEKEFETIWNNRCYTEPFALMG